MSDTPRPVISHLLFVDTETTGVDEGHHEVIEVAGILVERATAQQLERQVFRQRIRFPTRIHPKALEVNGIDPAAWNAEAPDDGLQQFAHWVQAALASHLDPTLERACVGGWNTTFDANMLALHPYDPINLRRMAGMDYHLYDVFSTAQDVLGPDANKLSAAAQMLGVTPSTHRAMQDAETAFLTWREFRHRVRLDHSVGC